MYSYCIRYSTLQAACEESRRVLILIFQHDSYIHAVSCQLGLSTFYRLLVRILLLGLRAGCWGDEVPDNTHPSPACLAFALLGDQ